MPEFMYGSLHPYKILFIVRGEWRGEDFYVLARSPRLHFPLPLWATEPTLTGKNYLTSIAFAPRLPVAYPYLPSLAGIEPYFRFLSQETKLPEMQSKRNQNSSSRKRKNQGRFNPYE